MKITHQEYNPTKEELQQELTFMYKKYEELCKAYKDLANRKNLTPVNEVHDMSHMKFENEKEMM
jgi:phage host-nuclease inhibitor protein Gam